MLQFAESFALQNEYAESLNVYSKWFTLRHLLIQLKEIIPKVQPNKLKIDVKTEFNFQFVQIYC